MRALLTMMLLAGCGFTPVEELVTPPDAGTSTPLTPLGSSTTGISYASCAPNDGPATAFLVRASTCAERGQPGLLLTVWGAPLAAGTSYGLNKAFPGVGGTAELCTSAGCEPLQGVLTIRSVTDAGIRADYSVEAPDGGQAFGTIDTLACPSLGLCG